jgi:hypothetical protein
MFQKFYLFTSLGVTEIHPRKKEEVFKNVRPARPQLLGRAERTERYVSTAKERERRWRHFSTLPR